MFATALLCLLTIAPIQAPTDQPAENEAWAKLTRLAGGEWVASGVGSRPNFHRFIYGPGQRSLWMHTRNAEKLDQWPQSESVYFWHPGEKTLKSFSVAAGDALADSVLEWKDERLDTSFDYYLAGRKLAYVSRWQFDGDKAYDWNLYSRTPTGLAEAIKVRFTHQEELRPLPEIAPPKFKPSEKLAFLDSFRGVWDVVAEDATTPSGRLEFRWVAGGSGMLVELQGLSKAAGLLTRGIMFWHPELKQVRLLEISASGEVQEGTVNPIEGGVSLDLQAFHADVSAHLTERWTQGPKGAFHGAKTRQVGKGAIQTTKIMLRRPE